MSHGTLPARPRAATKRDLLRLVRDAIARGDLPPEAEREAVRDLGALVRRLALTRRDLLKASAATAGLSLIATDLATRMGSAAGVAEASSLQAGTPSLTASVLRRDDMLALRFDFYNLVRQGADLVRQNAAQPAYVVATLGYGSDHAPQNIAERAYLETDTSGTTGETLDDPGKVPGLLAGPTRLAFRLPDGVASLPFTLNALLDFAQLPMNVAPAALPPGADPAVAPTIRAPEDTETAIETPWHLTLSPHAGAAWAHAPTPVVRGGRTELWHARLAVRKPSPSDPSRFVADETDAAQRTVRAIWTNGFDLNAPPNPADEGPFRMSLKPNDRYQIVRLSSDFTLPGDAPRPIDVQRLMLSALGAWQNSRGYWIEPPPGFNLGEWRHISTMGRDQFVRVVYLGWYLDPRNPAALVKISERKITNTSPRGAYLRQRFFIVTRMPVMTYPEQAPQPDGGRQMPFKRVEIKTLVTPILDDPADPNWCFESYGALAFWPIVDGKPFQFSIVGTDRDGQPTEFTRPLAFVSYPLQGFFTDADIAKVVDNYHNGILRAGVPFDPALKKANLGGQKVGMAPSTKSQGLPGGKPGDTAVEVKNITFSAVPPTATVPFGEAPFYPVWTEAEVRLNGVEQVAGAGLAPTVIEPHAGYLASGFASNAGSVFAKVKTAVPLSFVSDANPAVDRAGGLANLDMSIGGISRTLGPVGGDVTALPTEFDPSKFFAGAKILGGILLKDIVQTVGFGDLAKVPKLVTNTIYPDGDTLQPPEAVVTTVNFVPDLQADPLGIFDPDTDSATMSIDATFRTPIDPPGEPTYEIVGDLRNFRVRMLGTSAELIILSFNQLRFTTRNGNKPNIDVDIRDVTFAGVLEFVNTLKDFLKLGGTGPNIEIAPTSVTAGFAIPIPTVGVGVLTIQNIAFGAALNIPFTGKPARVRFNFSTRDDPFIVTVIGLGGGGFFGIALGMDGMELFEASIEVGASLALNLGVASGEVHAFAGIYYKLERKTTPPDEALLEGYVRLGGSLNVMGIASVSVEFYLGLRYEFNTNELWGQATLTVEVEVLMFSASYELTVERRIAGGDSASALPGLVATGGNGSRMASLAAQTGQTFDFTDLMNEDEWDAYAAAFATVS